MIVDGKAIAECLYADLAARYADMPAVTLGVVVASPDSVTRSFVRIKEKAAARLGVSIVREELQGGATTDEAIAAIERLTRRVQGIIVQLPLPEGIATEEVLAAVPKRLDVDGVNPSIPESDRLVRAPVARAVLHILEHASIEVRGKCAVVVGAGRLVGAPTAALLRDRGADVQTITEHHGKLSDIRHADIVVLGAGEPGLITPDLIKRGVALIDAGTSESNGKIVGDADPSCAGKAVVFTPVPGGVGPIAVAMIFENLLALTRP